MDKCLVHTIAGSNLVIIFDVSDAPSLFLSMCLFPHPGSKKEDGWRSA